MTANAPPSIDELMEKMKAVLLEGSDDTDGVNAFVSTMRGLCEEEPFSRSKSDPTAKADPDTRQDRLPKWCPYTIVEPADLCLRQLRALVAHIDEQTSEDNKNAVAITELRSLCRFVTEPPSGPPIVPTDLVQSIIRETEMMLAKEAWKGDPCNIIDTCQAMTQLHAERGREHEAIRTLATCLADVFDLFSMPVDDPCHVSLLPGLEAECEAVTQCWAQTVYKVLGKGYVKHTRQVASMEAATDWILRSATCLESLEAKGQ